MDGGGDDDDIGEIANPVGKIEGPDDDTPDQGMSSTTFGRRERKPLNPELFKKAVASVRQHLAGEGGGIDPADEMLETGPDAAAKAAAAAEAAKNQPPAPPPPPPFTG